MLLFAFFGSLVPDSVWARPKWTYLCRQALLGSPRKVVTPTEALTTSKEIRHLVSQLTLGQDNQEVLSREFEAIIEDWRPRIKKAPEPVIMDDSQAYEAFVRFPSFRAHRRWGDCVTWDGFVSGLWEGAPVDRHRGGNVLWGRVRNVPEGVLFLVTLSHERWTHRIFVDFLLGPFAINKVQANELAWLKDHAGRVGVRRMTGGLYLEVKDMELIRENRDLIEKLVGQVQSLFLREI